jgi:diguanylate cyclase (GGDEF)-like protein
VILITGQGNESLVLEVMKNGGQDYLIKGVFNASELQHSIDNAIRTNKLQNELKFLAHHDSLTGLISRTAFLAKLNRFQQKVKHNQVTGAIFSLDLDHFKRINDNYGHDIGDLVLQESGLRIINNIRESDTVCRIGGDEFIILFEGIGHDDADKIADKLIKSFQVPFKINDKEIIISCSIGIALLPNTASTAEELLKQSDKALYDAKAGGRGIRSNFTIEQLSSWRTQVRLERDIDLALSRNEIFFSYQPILPLKDGLPLRIEVLSRWMHPELGLISPDIFIPIMQKSGLIIEFTEWLFERVLANFSQAIKKHKNLILCINVPTSFCQNEQLASRFIEYLHKYDVKNESIEFEITETSLMENPELCAQLLRWYRKHGIAISIDDFGTGYSSLSFLADLPIDTLKIDKRFLYDIPNNDTNTHIINATIALSKSLGLKTVAEGVETQAQYDICVNQGCDYVQGYLLSKPVNENEIYTYMNHHFSNKNKL